MSCQIPQKQSELNPYTNTNNSLANLDMAFAPSQAMMNFQNKLVNQNPLLSGTVSSNAEVTGVSSSSNVHLVSNIQTTNLSKESQQINDNIQKILNETKTSADAKLDSKVDEVIGTIYDTNTPQPVLRNKRFNPNKYGSELLENFNGSYQPNDFYPQPNNGLSIFQLLLMIVLVAALIYGGYLIYKNYRQSGNFFSQKNINSTANISTPTNVASIPGKE